jgi:hypothetical protein
MIATAPTPLIISSERGLLPLQGLKLPVVQIETTADLDDVFEWLASSREASQYETVAWDSLSDSADALLVEEQKLGRKGKSGAVDKWAPYNALAEKMADKLRLARNITGKNWYLIAQEELQTMPNGAKMSVPSLPGKALLQQLPYLYDGVFKLVHHVDPVTREEARAVQCKGDNITLAGDRSGRLDMWEPTNLSHIFAKMRS